MTDRKKVEKTETQKLEYLENENRNIFIITIFEGYHLAKK